MATIAAFALVAAPRASHATEPEGDQTERATVEPPSPSQTPVASEQPSKRWYGWQILMADGAALTIGLASRNVAASLVAYGLPSPVLHLAHERPGAVLGALALRAALPVIAAVAGYSLEMATSNPCSRGQDLCFRGLGGALVGVFAGYLGAVVIDAAVLARENPPSERTDAPPRASRVRWQPIIGVTKTGASGGIGGVF
jgi:hypothetical protein